jgi:hypothetical protein
MWHKVDVFESQGSPTNFHSFKLTASKAILAANAKVVGPAQLEG